MRSKRWVAFPTRHIRYDNQRSSRSAADPSQIGPSAPSLSVERVEAKSGIGGVHDKGGVEGEVGRFRRTHLSPMPVVDSLAEPTSRSGFRIGPMSTGGSEPDPHGAAGLHRRPSGVGAVAGGPV